MKTKEEMIRELGLQPLPGEGGFFAQLERAEKKIRCRLWSSGAEVERPEKTAIHYLAGGEDFSALHWLEFDEHYRFVDGEPCTLVTIWPNGDLEEAELSKESPRGIVRAGSLQGLRSRGEWSLVSCVMSPGFEYEDLHVPSREELLARFPRHSEAVKKFTREK